MKDPKFTRLYEMAKRNFWRTFSPSGKSMTWMRKTEAFTVS